MRQPIIYTAETIKNWDIDKNTVSGKWIPARPYGHNLFSLFYRFKLIFLVFIGKYDVLNWEE